MAEKLKIIWDMETGDPDDVLTLILLLGHPRVELRAINVTPGTPDQIGFVRHIVHERFERDLPIGAYDLDHGKRCLTPWHPKTFGKTPDSRDALPGASLLSSLGDEETTLVTGASLKNLGAAIEAAKRQDSPLKLKRLVAQGGFAGDNIVPEPDRLPKFQGKRCCPTYNLDGAIDAAKAALDYEGIGSRWFVSKNVCHGVYYDHALHERVAQVRAKSQSLSLIYEVMEGYLRRKPEGKKFHDPLAACCALDPGIGRWAQVRLERTREGWGAQPALDSDTWIITGYDHERFVQTLLMTP